MSITRPFTRAVVVGGLAAAALVPVSAADAVKPHKEFISEPYSFVAEDDCGIEDEVEIDGLFELVLQIHNRRGLDFFIEHQVVRETHTLGDVSVTRVSRPTFRDLKIVDQGDTLLITVLGTGPDGKAISRNPGQPVPGHGRRGDRGRDRGVVHGGQGVDRSHRRLLRRRPSRAAGLSARRGPGETGPR